VRSCLLPLHIYAFPRKDLLNDRIVTGKYGVGLRWLGTSGHYYLIGEIMARQFL
jgi:hypothetical protein